jgi:hypothetical protein
MPPKLSPIWAVFHRSENMPNGKHHRATHWRCINAERPTTEPIDIDVENNWELMKNEGWFEAGALLI